MKYGLRKVAVSALMVLALIATLCVGCAGEEEGQIIIGHISDMTGPASTALVPINYAIEDLAKYYNENDIIPGAKIKVVTYDARYNPKYDIPGWNWVRDRGAKVAVTALPTTAETLDTRAETDKMPLWALITTPPLIDPPGWVFCANSPTYGLIDTLLQWISEEDWDWETNGPAKIGSAGWQEPYAIACRDAIRDYAQAHPQQFEWVGGFLAPMGVNMWSGEVEALKNCDYLFPPSTGTGTSTFIKQYRDKGYDAPFIGTDAHAAYRDLIIDLAGWDAVDGMLASQPTRWWGETGPVVELAEELLSNYHPDQYDALVHAGIGYIGGFHQCYAFFQVLEETVKEVGLENYDSQAFYDTAIGFETTWDGYETWGFSDTKRYTWNYTGIYEWSAADEDIVRKVTDWLPIVLE